MKAFIICFAIFSIAYSHSVIRIQNQTSYLVTRNSEGRYEIEDLTRKITCGAPKESDIKFFFHTRNGPADGTEIHADDTEGIRNLGFSEEKPTLFIVHGWKNQFDSMVIETIAKAALEGQDINVFGVDWSKIAWKTYLEAFYYVPEVGKLLGQLIENLVVKNGLRLETTSVAGHSLGAHVAGIACAQVGGQCDLVVGLDPALPLFSYNNKENRLDTSDAKFVHVIHTNAGQLGFDKPIGHADYFPNGGHHQPGCVLDVVGSCCHSRSYLYYAESLVTGNFRARKCESYDDYNNGRCNDGPESIMGQFQVDKSASGSYFLNTYDSPPFAMGDGSWNQ